MTLKEGGVRISAPVSGEAVPVLRPSGAQAGYSFSQQFEGTTLLQVVVGHGLRQERRFNLNAAGTILTVDVRVTGPLLSAPAVARATYRRG